jgi:D-serine deaminase-like pyridoxal phosphate-dependent protein
MGYEGHAGMLPADEKEAACREAVARLTKTADACRSAGLPVEIVSGGGTGTWNITAAIPGVTELQAGTYAVMDVLFRERAGAEFGYACTVLTTIISRPTTERAVTDAGKKSLHPSFGMPVPFGMDGVEVTGLNSEHGILTLSDEARALRVADRVRLVPYYAEGTINLFDVAYAVRGGQVVAEWEIATRNRSQ